MQNFSLLRIIRYSAIALIIALSLVMAGVFIYQNGAEKQGDVIAGIKMGTHFSIINVKTGEKVDESAFQGRPQALYFGFTHCPDVCPTTLIDMESWINALGEEAETIHFAMISIDPERDNASLLSHYLENFHPSLQGYTGSLKEIEKMRLSYRIHAEKIFDDENDPDNYTMDHTASVLLLNAKSQFIGTIAYQEDPKAAIAKLKRLLNNHRAMLEKVDSGFSQKAERKQKLIAYHADIH